MKCPTTVYFEIEPHQLPIIYRSEYNVRFCGLEKLHPFDAAKWSHVFHFLKEAMLINDHSVTKPNEVQRDDLLVVHTPEYLKSLEWSWNVARIAEIPPLSLVPNFIVQKCYLKPMRYQTGGSILAGKLALDRGWAINIGGGFHHCSKDRGGGFCPYADITLLLKFLFLHGRNVKKAMIVDLDAHQGNGYERDFLDQHDVYILDVYNKGIYPKDELAKKAIKRHIELYHFTEDDEYLTKVDIPSATVKMIEKGKLLQFVNCNILRNHSIFKEDIWVRDGKIVDPEKIFFDEKIAADEKIDCGGLLLAPGFIDLQINGGFGIDFSNEVKNVEDGLRKVAKGVLSHGVTSFCPTLVTSPPHVYEKVLPKIRKQDGSCDGATVLGIHVEGPFINKEKKGAHPENCILTFDKGFETLMKVYGTLENVAIVTLAPELPNAGEVIEKLTSKGIAVSLGHSVANLHEGEIAVKHGASFITHLFNAMLPFHHRDPGLVGLLASNSVPSKKTVYFGIISDGIHTHPAALRIAHRTHPKGLVLVTDAISAMGLEEGTHRVGQLAVEIHEGKAFVAGTRTLCGSIATMDKCIKIFQEATACSIVSAIEAATLHPALTLGISHRKGTLEYGADADFVLLGSGLDVLSTWIAGECVYKKNDTGY